MLPAGYDCDCSERANCACPATAAPGGLAPEEVPQFILFTHGTPSVCAPLQWDVGGSDFGGVFEAAALSVVDPLPRAAAGWHARRPASCCRQPAPACAPSHG